jgi:hypothetical protein
MKKQKLKHPYKNLVMKKSILTWALILMVGISTSFAHGKEGVSEKVINSFKKEFTEAQNVQWESTKDLAKATFTIHGQVMFAYYNNDGNLLAVTRNIVAAQLPISLLTDIKKNYNEYWISDLFEMSSDNNTTYYITLENGDQKVVLKSDDSRNWETFKKEKKVVS